jgi:hypothetical protein
MAIWEDEQAPRPIEEPTSTDASLKSPEENIPETTTAADRMTSEVDESKYPKGFQLILIILSLCLAVFLVALDQTIIAPALGAITSEFESVKDIVRFARPSCAFAMWYADHCRRAGVSLLYGGPKFECEKPVG